MKDDLINILKNSDKALDIYEIQKIMNITYVDEIKELEDVLKKLEEDVVIYCSNKNRYMMLEDSHLKKGIMRVNKKGFGVVEVEGLTEDIYISHDNVNGAIHDDFVLEDFLEFLISQRFAFFFPRLILLFHFLVIHCAFLL